MFLYRPRPFQHAKIGIQKSHETLPLICLLALYYVLWMMGKPILHNA
jgi:hypothetical protein